MMSEATGMVWLVNRLRCMSVAEVGYRIRQAAVTRVAKRVRARAAPPLPRARTFNVQGSPALPQPERDALLADADSICAGHVVLFGNRRFDVGMPPVWNRDPDSGVVGPSIYGGDIATGNREQVGDIQHVWELNRHLHLVRLAQAWALTHDPAWLHALHTQLRSWLDQCPPLVGPNWTSPLELGIRLVNWGLVWQLVGGEGSSLFAGEEGERLRADWLDSIHAHCSAIARNLSRHSSADNHLIGELAGLYVGASVWPCWDASGAWQDQARRELEHEAQVQFSRDGVNREQAFAYHVFALECLFVAGLVGQACDHPFSRAYWTALQRAQRFLRSVRDVGGNVPRVGDTDAGLAFRLDAPGGNRIEQLLALGDAVLHRLAPAHPGVRWLLHTVPGKRPEADPHESETGWAFPDGGYLLFGSHFGEANEIKGMVDCGPLGYLGFAAHGHADALALTLSVGGEECLVDPGAYASWQEPKWREYFRGTSAHNTVRIDGLDQSVSGGRAMWLKKARASIERMPQSPHEFDFRGAHDGYERLADPVRHMRSVRFDAASATLTVRDEIAAKKHHQFELFWHFAPGLDVRLNSSGLHVRGKRFTLQMHAHGADLKLELVRGHENPPLGWYAGSAESMQPCDVLKISAVSSAVPVECKFTIAFF
jgi:hypothetical protein